MASPLWSTPRSASTSVLAADYRPLRLTPAERGSGRTDISIEHDRELYVTPE